MLTDCVSRLQMVMPGGDAYGSNVSYFGPALVTAVQSGLVPESRLDDMATRILSSWYVHCRCSATYAQGV